MKGSPAWYYAFWARDYAALRKELAEVTDINGASGMDFRGFDATFLWWTACSFDRCLRATQYVLDAGADPNQPWHFDTNADPPLPRTWVPRTVLQYMEQLDPRGHDSVTWEFAQLLIRHGARYEGTMFEFWVKQQHEKNRAVVWCFANVLPQGARDIAFDFLGRFQELPWGEFPWPPAAKRTRVKY